MDERQHRSLYRKYRPQRPDEVIGQEHVIRALMGAVREGRLAHAFLFTGPRGTGKTSTARILAKMVNCEQGPTAEPCGVCEACVAIRDGRHLDVDEIDAASHSGVDYARELRERAPTAPVQGREKVYIIDEAQRLSAPAFDALLKLLEEPPPGVRFVLATTEPHKMPATIVGRCQRFDFRRVQGEVAADHVARVAKEEGLSVTPEAAQAIARHAEGSLRDALSLLDQAAVLGGGTVDEDTVATLAGAADLDVRFELADAVAAQDARAVFQVIERLVQEGHDIRDVTAQATAHFRDLFLALVAPEQAELIGLPEDQYPRLIGQAAKFTAQELNRILSLLVEANTNLRWTTSPRLTLELALIQAALPEADPRSAGLLSRLERLERLSGVSDGSAPPPPPTPSPSRRASTARSDAGAPTPTTPVTEPEPQPTAAERPIDETAPRAGEPAAAVDEPHRPTTGAVDGDLVRRSWGDVVKELKAARQVVLSTQAQYVVAHNLDGDTLELVFPAGKGFAADNIQRKEGDLRAVLRSVFGVDLVVRCVVRDGPAVDNVPDVVDEEPTTPEAALERVMEGLGAEIVEE